MSKNNKELAVDVALKIIEAHAVVPYGPNNARLSSCITGEQISNIINTVYATLEKLDKDQN